ncbi:hypothetical protein M3Y94_00607600 [Aphelenchoides besseyi]|nr:hypothetical protein M3Y94_00607600 [Aphelenchoides besseyi]KAI6222283.1 Lipase EstA/Esterase EstB family-containing protein [Aphelenchoides besseyi]
MKLTVPVVFFCFLISLSTSTISSSFRDFIRQKYGATVERRIARDDFANGRGSFGGGNHKSATKTKKRPVILVHGSSTVAAHGIPIASVFRTHGYTDSELYATTYGEPTNSQFGLVRGYRCEYVKGVRDLIRAVAAFTKSKVDVIGYSMGGPISRKAILGGRCVDTGEDLGEPFTSKVHSYLSVAGVQRSTTSCGVRCGNQCGGNFMNDINSRTHYEGHKVYVLQSTDDRTIRPDRCGKWIGELAEADHTVTLSGYGHIGVCLKTAEIQHKIIHGRK